MGERQEPGALGVGRDPDEVLRRAGEIAGGDDGEAVAAPLLATGAAVIWTQVAKLSAETWSAPEHVVSAMFVVRVAIVIG